MKMQQILIGLILSILTVTTLSAEEQFYNSTLLNFTSVSKIITSSESKVLFGKIDNDFIQLKSIPSGNDGYIKFNIQQTNDVDVFLHPSNDESKAYGFKFESDTKFRIYSAGILVDPAQSVNDYYSFSDEFMVEICGDNILYFKNDELIYSECYSQTEDFYHRTEVISADNTNLYLTFENNSSSCTNGLIGESNSEVNLKSSSTTVTTQVEPFSLVIASIYTQKGEFVKQLRIRANSQGSILDNKFYKEYIDSDYIIKLNSK